MIDFSKVPSPCYVLDEQLLMQNLATIDRVRRESGAEIIVALKACAMWSIFPTLAQHSDGATASSLAEARLVFEEYGEQAHTYAPVYTEREIEELMNYSSHITRSDSLIASARVHCCVAFRVVCASIPATRPLRPTSTILVSRVRAWVLRVRSWANSPKASRACISMFYASRAPNICARPSQLWRSILETYSTR